MTKSCPGGKIRSQGKGKGLGIGKQKGPIGIPTGKESPMRVRKLPKGVKFKRK